MDERAMAASVVNPSFSQLSVTIVGQTYSDRLTEGEDEESAERAEEDKTNLTKMSGSMSADTMDYDLEGLMPTVAVADSCSSYNDLEAVTDGRTDPMDCQPELPPTVFDLPVQIKTKQQKGPTARNQADTKHWRALLPRLHKPYLALIEQRHDTVISSFITDDALYSACNNSCTSVAITVDCLFLEGKSTVGSKPVVPDEHRRQEEHCRILLRL